MAASTLASGASTVTTVAPTEGTSSELDGIIEAATADLIERLDAESASIEVVVAEPITWPDGRLGCSDFTLPYTLEPVEGYRVVIRHEGRLYHYHVGSDATPRLCESLSKPSGRPEAPEPSIPPPIK
jgi:hypothetical protein